MDNLSGSHKTVKISGTITGKFRKQFQEHFQRYLGANFIDNLSGSHINVRFVIQDFGFENLPWNN
jgi:hypothetical protein